MEPQGHTIEPQGHAVAIKYIPISYSTTQIKVPQEKISNSFQQYRKKKRVPQEIWVGFFHSTGTIIRDSRVHFRFRTVDSCSLTKNFCFFLSQFFESDNYLQQQEIVALIGVGDFRLVHSRDPRPFGKWTGFPFETGEGKRRDFKHSIPSHCTSYRIIVRY